MFSSLINDCLEGFLSLKQEGPKTWTQSVGGACKEPNVHVLKGAAEDRRTGPQILLTGKCALFKNPGVCETSWGL